MNNKSDITKKVTFELLPLPRISNEVSATWQQGTESRDLSSKGLQAEAALPGGQDPFRIPRSVRSERSLSRFLVWMNGSPLHAAATALSSAARVFLLSG
ncbi:hypothetical protein HHI36_019288 [Cryptolaemus montrouzieri]|uniref:Uncharacterized protein n=1 Tax=Cryptolaemus montrouzieri TaxID=559131 RepID=A0ABD2P2F7_9CUCU